MIAPLTLLFSSRATLEDPTTSMTQAADMLLEAWGGAASDAGVRVTPEIALTLDTVWRGINIVSSYVAKLPLDVFQRIGENGKERARKHPAFPLLRRWPNSECTAFVFRQVLQGHALGHGNGYGYIYRIRGGARDAQPREIVILDPARTRPVRRDGRLWYVHTLVSGEERWLPAEDVIHIRGYGYDGLQGYSIFAKARESIGHGLATRKYGNLFFKNSAEARVVLEHPGSLSVKAMENLKASWNAMHQGLENSHKTAVLEQGMKANRISLSPQDAQLVESQKFSVRAIANWFGLPPHKLGDDAKSSYSSIEQENQSLLDDCIDPWLVVWEQECEAKLLTEEEKANDTHFVEFNRKALVRADLNARGAYYAKATGGLPWMVADDVRAAENMNPLPDEVGQQYIVPQNIAGKPADTQRIRPHLEVLLREAVERMVRRIGHQADRAAKQPERFGDWLDAVDRENRSVVMAALRPIAMVMAEIDAVDPRGVLDDLVGLVCAGARDAFTEIYDSTPEREFAAAISARSARLEAELSARCIGAVQGCTRTARTDFGGHDDASA